MTEKTLGEIFYNAMTGHFLNHPHKEKHMTLVVDWCALSPTIQECYEIGAKAVVNEQPPVNDHR